MTSGNNFWDFEMWSFIITLSIIYCAMLFANLLRRLIPFIKKSLIPSPVLAGFILLILSQVYQAIFDKSLLNVPTLEALTYHGLGLGFVAVALKGSKKKNTKKATVGYFDTGLATVSSYLIQGITGLSITLILSYIITDVFPSSGLILPLGYGQGPGQAYNWGKTYEDLYQFKDGASFGLTVAAMGFIFASIGGIIYLKKLKKLGKYNLSSLGEGVTARPEEQISENNEIPDSESMDKLSVQIGFVFLGYIITYLIMFGLYKIFDASKIGFLLETVNPLIWGFNFLIGTIVGVLLKSTVYKLYDKKIIKRKYLNNYMLTRVSGVMFDLMVVGSIAAIDLKAFTNPSFIIPLTLICLTGGVVTYYYIKFVCNKIFPEYKDEQFLALYGMNTGTASTGVILLREIDPHLETPASSNIVFQSLYAIIFGFPMLLLLGFAPRTTLGVNGWAWLTLGLLIVLFALMSIIQFRNFIFKKKSKK